MQDSKVSEDSGTGAPGQDFSTVKSIMLPRGTIFGLHCFAFLRAILAASCAASHSSFPIKAFMRRNYA
jgi:Mg2+/Co2+ transporter CorC